MHHSLSKLTASNLAVGNSTKPANLAVSNQLPVYTRQISRCHANSAKAGLPTPVTLSNQWKI